MHLVPLVAHAENARWQVQRLMVNKLGASGSYAKGVGKRVLLLTYNNRILQSQAFPFFLYRKPLRQRYDISVREVDVGVFEASSKPQEHADLVLFQVWFDFDQDRIRRICEKIHKELQPKRVVFLDGFAHTDLRLAACLDPYIDLYVKKHLFRDRSAFKATTLGDTNLMEYYGSRYGLSYPTVNWGIPDGFLDKLVLGPGFVTAPDLLPRLCSSDCPDGERPIDIHSRLGFKGSDWYESMRRESLAIVSSLSGKSILVTPDASRRQYIGELKRSKLCYSPFGYGEVAWRDFEAIAYGAVLMKPDMDHLEMNPNLFLPSETYVPLNWDYSDTAEKMSEYLSNAEARRRLATRAHSVARDYLREARFVDQMGRVFE